MKHFLLSAIFFFTFLITSAQVDLNRGLVAWYPFNGNANDVSGNGLHGIVQNGATLTSDRYGTPNSAYLFDGIDDYIEIPDNPRLRFRDSFSVCISYMKLSQPGGNLIEKRSINSGANSSFDIAAGANGANGAVKTWGICSDAGSGWNYTSFTQPPALNQWYCLVMTFNAGTLQFYEDGVLISSTTTSNPWVDSCAGSNIRIGYHLSFDPIPLNGKVDDVRMYNRALTTEEVRSLCGTPAQVGNIINAWTPVIAYNSCQNTLTVEDASTFKIGDTVLIIQMKGASADTSNSSSFGSITDYRSAGNYEFNYVKAITGNDITLTGILNRTYEIPSGAVQLVRVPYYENATISTELTCIPWDGSRGGVLVLNVANNLHFNADINVNGKGFRGGNGININQSGYNCSSNSYYYGLTGFLGAAKAEGISSVSADKSYGKGKLANGGGGGNAHNSGGGGGSNGTTGGTGGYQLEPSSFSPCNGSATDNRGLPGSALIYNNTENRIFLGGGGGAGHDNNPEQFGAAGGNGGGIVIITANTVTGNSHTVNSKGAGGLECNLPGVSACHEGMGGGGAGGTVLLNVNSINSNLTVNISGGKGADMVAPPGYTRVGPGGGGSGGVCWFKGSNATGTTIISAGGASGVCTQTASNPYGAAAGNVGINLFSLTLPVDTVPFVPCTLPVTISAFSATAQGSLSILLKWKTEDEKDIKHYVVERSEGNGIFKELGIIAANNSSVGSQYFFSDKTARLHTTYFYRIKAVELTGAGKYSQVRNARLGATNGYNVNVYPNPAKNIIHIELTGTQESAFVKLFSCTGVLIHQKKLTPGYSTALTLENLTSGTYFLHVIHSSGNFIKQIVKQ